MKKNLLTIVAALAMGVVGVQGQGNIQFNNFSGGAVTGGLGFAGSPFLVSVYWQAGTVAGTAATFIPGATYAPVNAPMFGAGPLTEVNQNNGAGFFDGGVYIVPGSTPAGTYTFCVVAYSGAASYAAALVNPTSWTGASTLFQVSLVTGATPPNTMISPSFVVAPVPEPSTFALAGLGLAGLLIFRRRN